MGMDPTHPDSRSLEASEQLTRIVSEPVNYGPVPAEMKQGLGRHAFLGRNLQPAFLLEFVKQPSAPAEEEGYISDVTFSKRWKI